MITIFLQEMVKGPMAWNLEAYRQEMDNTISITNKIITYKVILWHL